MSAGNSPCVYPVPPSLHMSLSALYTSNIFMHPISISEHLHTYISFCVCVFVNTMYMQQQKQGCGGKTAHDGKQQVQQAKPPCSLLLSLVQAGVEHHDGACSTCAHGAACASSTCLRILYLLPYRAQRDTHNASDRGRANERLRRSQDTERLWRSVCLRHSETARSGGCSLDIQRSLCTYTGGWSLVIQSSLDIERSICCCVCST